MSRALHLIGQRFGRLTVTAFLRPAPNGYVWQARCDCGQVTECNTGKLINGNTQSCGCLKRELVAAKNFVHGFARRGHAAEYSAYWNARRRCTNRRDRRWKDYGGRGIKFRFASLVHFMESVGRKPSPDHVLDRIDNDGNYEPGNVRWATVLESMNNKRHGGCCSHKMKCSTLLPRS